MQEKSGGEGSELLLVAADFAQRRGWPVDLLASACEEHRMFCLIRNGVSLYPDFFADPRYDPRQLEAITKRLGDLPSGSKWQFFTTGKGLLGGVTPLEALRAGQFALVMRCAEGFVER